MSLFAFGLGYCSGRVIARGRFAPAAGTARTPEGVADWRRRGVEAFRFDGTAVEAGAREALGRARYALVSIPPEAGFDPTLAAFQADLARAGVERVVYLSSVGVYGDAAGDWIDESSPPRAITARAAARLDAEAAWRAFARGAGVALDILRLGGIYGPGRSAFDRLREGTARRIVKPGQTFNRIHVDDVAGAVETVIAAVRPGAVYNVVDGAPSPPEDVIVHAADLIGLAAPPPEPFERAALSDLALSFYQESRRIRPLKLMEIGWKPRYPSYREGLAAILAEEAGAIG